MLVTELKSEALKERHWKQLMRQLRVNWVLSELTLGQIWDVDLQKNENIIRDVINIAQGEMALEEFLKQVWRVNKFCWQKWDFYQLLVIVIIWTSCLIVLSKSWLYCLIFMGHSLASILIYFIWNFSVISWKFCHWVFLCNGGSRMVHFICLSAKSFCMLLCRNEVHGL